MFKLTSFVYQQYVSISTFYSMSMCCCCVRVFAITWASVWHECS